MLMSFICDKRQKLEMEGRVAENSKILCDNLAARKALFETLGGLPETAVQNGEWLYMLGEETRNSVAVEGYFATEQELRAVLRGRKSFPEILNYYRIAQSTYDLALQYAREGEVRLDLSLVRHVHSELFRELSHRRGEFRLGRIEIQRAKIRPPEFDVVEYVRCWIQLSLVWLETLPILPALARSHTLFESIHPFDDGNGRAGRILLNYLAVSKGYPPIIIKGFTQEERDRYYHALEAADQALQQGFPGPQSERLWKQLERGRFSSLEELLYEGLLMGMDPLIVAAMERREPLIEFKLLAPQLGVQESTLRQWVHRGKLLAAKRGKKLYSHPRLLLDRGAALVGSDDDGVQR